MLLGLLKRVQQLTYTHNKLHGVCIKSYRNQNNLPSVPDHELFERIRRSRATIAEAQDYYQALQVYIHGNNYDDPQFNIVLDQSFIVEGILEGAGALERNAAVVDDSPAKTDSTSLRLERTYFSQKSMSEIQAEILAAATSSNPKLALTRVAAVNNMHFELVEFHAKSLLHDKGLSSQYDLDKSEYTKLFESVRDLELNISDPGEKEFKLLKIAKQHKLALPQLQQIYFKSLIIQHLSEPIDDKELEKLYPGGQKWVMRGWIPEEAIIVFHAHGTTGKTLFVQHLIKHIATGTDWEEYKVEKPGSILYLQTDTAPSN